MRYILILLLLCGTAFGQATAQKNDGNTQIFEYPRITDLGDSTSVLLMEVYKAASDSFKTRGITFENFRAIMQDSLTAQNVFALYTSIADSGFAKTSELSVYSTYAAIADSAFAKTSELAGAITSNATVSSNAAHRTGDGSDHADVATNTSTLSTGFASGVQDVGTGAAPNFSARNMTNIPQNIYLQKFLKKIYEYDLFSEQDSVMICVFGDSRANGDDEFIALFKDSLQVEYSNANIHIDNFSWGGYHSLHFKAMYQKLLFSNQYDLVIWAEDETNEYSTNSAGKKILYDVYNYTDADLAIVIPNPGYVDANADAEALWWQKIAVTLNAQIIDVKSAWDDSLANNDAAGDSTFYLADMTHPSAKGTQVYLSVMLPLFRKDNINQGSFYIEDYIELEDVQTDSSVVSLYGSNWTSSVVDLQYISLAVPYGATPADSIVFRKTFAAFDLYYYGNENLVLEIDDSLAATHTTTNNTPLKYVTWWERDAGNSYNDDFHRPLNTTMVGAWPYESDDLIMKMITADSLIISAAWDSFATYAADIKYYEFADLTGLSEYGTGEIDIDTSLPTHDTTSVKLIQGTGNYIRNTSGLYTNSLLDFHTSFYLMADSNSTALFENFIRFRRQDTSWFMDVQTKNDSIKIIVGANSVVLSLSNWMNFIKIDYTNNDSVRFSVNGSSGALATASSSSPLNYLYIYPPSNGHLNLDRLKISSTNTITPIIVANGTWANGVLGTYINHFYKSAGVPNWINEDELSAGDKWYADIKDSYNLATSNTARECISVSGLDYMEHKVKIYSSDAYGKKFDKIVFYGIKNR